MYIRQANGLCVCVTGVRREVRMVEMGGSPLTASRPLRAKQMQRRDKKAWPVPYGGRGGDLVVSGDET